MRYAKRQIEYGDFQTPGALADRVCAFLAEDGLRPASVLEPTCGAGAFLLAALRRFPNTTMALGVEINPTHLSVTKQRLGTTDGKQQIELRLADFFDVDWPDVLRALPKPVLVVGNPPWVTAARVGAIAGSNLPRKSNFLKLRGMDAKTGKSNFDVSEWMAMRLLESAKDYDVTFALLLKASVARRVLLYAWSRSIPIASVRFLEIDASDAFGVSTAAGVLSVRTGVGGVETSCQVFPCADWGVVRSTFGMRGGIVVADLDAYERTAQLRCSAGRRPAVRWRSGMKHDCARVMELHTTGGRLFNLLGEPVDVEQQWVFPLLKGSAIGGALGSKRAARARFVIVPQRGPSEDTSRLAAAAPRLWKYLTDHETFFDRRRSAIYRHRPRFSVFGVGPYTFSRWKVAICGLYKHLRFAVVGPKDQQPVVLDDTCYHLSFDEEEEARLVAELLNSEIARRFLASRIFWDAKRPVTAELLEQLDLSLLAEELGRGADWDLLARRSTLFETVAG